MPTPEDIFFYNKILFSQSPDFSEMDHQILMLARKGIIFELSQDCTTESVDLLVKITTTSPSLEIMDTGFLTLGELSNLGCQIARDAIYQLEIEYDHPLATDLIIGSNIISLNPVFNVVHCLLVEQIDRLFFLDPKLEMVSAYFLGSNSEIQKRLLKAADHANLAAWCEIMMVLVDPNGQRIRDYVTIYGTLPEKMRQIALREFSRYQGDSVDQIRDLVCQIFIKYSDNEARTAAEYGGFCPTDPIQRALFLFFSERWAELEQLDFDHSMIQLAYETSSADIRKRIIVHSKYTGQSEWFSAIAGRPREKLVSDLSEADWHYLVDNLWLADRKELLWKLSQACPPRLCAQIMIKLAASGWAPGNPEDTTAFEKLTGLAAVCVGNNAISDPETQYQSCLSEITCTAYHAGSKIIALGGSSNTISLFSIPEFDLSQKQISLPVAHIRALCFSPDGEYLACAGGDHKIRIIQTRDLKMVKTFEGHTGLIRSIQFDLNGRQLYSAGFDGSIRIWRFPQGPEIRKFGDPNSEVMAMILSNQAHYLLAAGTRKIISVFGLPNGDLLYNLESHPDTITMLAGSGGGLVQSFCRDHNIRIWNVISKKLVTTIFTGNNASAITLSKDERLVWAGFQDGRITMWDTSTGDLLAGLSGHNGQISGLILTPDDEMLVSSSLDGRICTWNNNYIHLLTHSMGILNNKVGYFSSAMVYSKLNQVQKRWVNYIKALAQYNSRYDIQLSEPKILSTDKFDIIL
jgi:WD40 repeat protein